MMHQLLAKKYGFKNEADHINGFTYDNRLRNLRDVNRCDNMKNTRLYDNNKSGYKGVCYNKRQKQWTAYINHNKKHIHLGTFDSKNEAIKIRKAAERKYFGEYLREEVV